MQPTNSYQNDSNPIVLFDGVCNLCATSVRFLLAYNRKENLNFASLQSEYAKELLSKYNLNSFTTNTIVFIEDQQIYTKSSAVFEISKHLIYPWKTIYHFKCIPNFITDWIYELIARNRYQWFGKKNQCMVPKPEWRHRFWE